MSYKLLRIARGDKTPLAGFEVNAYVENAYYDQRNLANLLEEFVSVRRATLSLINGLAEVASERVGVTNDKLVTARSIAFIIAGHELHHLNIIKERYLAY
ncbi:DinB family protein [Paenibacillus vini]|nr:DinB family protein [Paenibacillus vini]MDN4071297.1 DinB family protein [Paenibacillus vini]